MKKDNSRFGTMLMNAEPPHPSGKRLHNRSAELLHDDLISPVCPNILYRYLPFGISQDGKDFTKRTLQMIRDGAFWFSPPKHLNDPCEMAFVKPNSSLKSAPKSWLPLSREVAESREKCRVCCFAGEWNQGPMWAHYATGQTGICIGFSTEELKTAFFKVNYEERDLSEFSGPEGLLLAMTTKSRDWAYEAEWRLIYPWSMWVQPANDGEIGGCHQYLNCPVREVIFGRDVADDEIEQIAEIVAAYNNCLLYTSPSPRDQRGSRMPSSA